MKENKFIEELKRTIYRFGLLKKGDRVVVALSGGPDSVALLHGLLDIQSEFGLKLYVAHLNHKLRGAESDEDERFAKKLAGHLKLKFFSKKIDVKGEAKRKKLGIEESAREIRYRYLENLAVQIKADKIAFGHQADDQAETFLMRLLRGAGGAGLSGIPPKRGKIIRPLIQIRREEIETFLKANQIPYRLDSSNYLTDYFRNKIRLTLLPKIKEEFNPKIVESLNRTADIISLQQEYIKKKCEQILQDIGIKRKNKMILDLKEFAAYDICLQREMIRFSIKQLQGDLNQLVRRIPRLRRGSFESVDRALNLIHRKKSGKKVKLVAKIWLEVSGNELAFYREEKKKYNYPLTLPGEVNLSAGQLSVDSNETQMRSIGKDWGIKINGEIHKGKLLSQNLIPQNQNTAFLDWEKLKKPFRLRSRRRGDKFKPLGMKGTKSLADFLIDAKVPRHLRDEVPILTSKGKIVWVVGYRISDEFKVNQKTKKVLKLEATVL
ncbi:MAG: tRNA lysidine(34) synthetase TilS [candidate division Zixibacteria bacterium]|nr:tRNA lysidine(34) synthetase TilS [candidate division Zixibacteria bacterium]